MPVPLYETSSAEQVLWILTDADVSLLVVESAAHAAVVDEVRADTPHLRELLVIDDGAIDALVTGGAEVGDDEIARRRALASLTDVATIIYTSGTTGRPKGVELTHGNFYELTVNAVADLHEVFSEPGARTLLFMPLAHVFARFIEVLCIPAGAVLGHSPSTVTLIEDLGTFRPDVHPRGPPRVREGLQLRRAEGCRRRQGLDLPAGRQDLDRLLARARQPARARARGSASSTRSRTPSCCTSCATRWAVRRAGPSRAARPSASGWATSTVASA